MPNNENWKVEIQDRPAQLLTDIWIFRRNFSNNKTIVYLQRDNDSVEEREISIGERPPATLTVPTDIMAVILDAITKKGIKPPAESFVTGKLEATENHLQDLRHLLKLK